MCLDDLRLCLSGCVPCPSLPELHSFRIRFRRCCKHFSATSERTDRIRLLQAPPLEQAISRFPATRASVMLVTTPKTPSIRLQLGLTPYVVISRLCAFSETLFCSCAVVVAVASSGHTVVRAVSLLLLAFTPRQTTSVMMYSKPPSATWTSVCGFQTGPQSLWPWARHIGAQYRAKLYQMLRQKIRYRPPCRWAS